MDNQARQQVLADYRWLRRTRMAPYQVMEHIRNEAANQLALYVAHDKRPPLELIARWRAATDYLNSMTARTSWWWHPTIPRQAPRRRQTRRRRTTVTG